MLRPRPSSLFLAITASLAPAALACSGGNTAAQLVAPPEFAPKGESKCGVVKSQAQPLIVEWPDTERGKLESAVKKGVVAVRYEGCEMQVLDRCRAPGGYGYSALTRKRSQVRMRDADELYANIPIYAARFEGALQRSGELNVKMTVVGRYEADRASVRGDELTGDCAGATHVIGAITVGAFEFFAGSDATVGGGATVGGAGVGAKSAATRETLSSDGDPARCEPSTSADKSAPEGCGALLRLEVVPLGEAKRAEPVCPNGTKWDGAQCVHTQVVTKIECPPGTRLEGASCVANVKTDCGAGMHFVAGTGCVPDVVAAPAPAPAPKPTPTPAPPVASGGPPGMVQIPGGTFMMGSATGKADEKPVHSVTVAPFWMEVTEVTVAAYQACVKAGKCAIPETGGTCNWGKGGRAKHPINCVTWDQAAAYCAFAGARLPTEAEWEFAARGADSRKYPWGNADPDKQLCWHRPDGAGTCAVGSFPASVSPFGLQDMSGNVMEWTSSAYCSYDAGATCTSSSWRVMRGSFWNIEHPLFVTTTARVNLPPYTSHSGTGVRCARSN